MNRSITLRLFFVFFVSSITATPEFCVAQKSNSSEDLFKKISGKRFTFIAEQAIPLKGPMRVLASPYDVIITPDSLVSFLPYFGFSQLAPLNTDQGGIMFSSVNFEYGYSKQKKDKLAVLIRVMDQQNSYQFSFTISNNGNTSLNISSSYKDPILFRGYIKN